MKFVKIKSEEWALIFKFSANKDGDVFKPDGDIQRTKFNRLGYELFSCKGKTVLVHRFVWRFFNSEISSECHIDHIDRIPMNNQLKNLRMVSISENMKNKGPIKRRLGRFFHALNLENEICERITAKEYRWLKIEENKWGF